MFQESKSFILYCIIALFLRPHLSGILMQRLTVIGVLLHEQDLCTVNMVMNNDMFSKFFYLFIIFFAVLFSAPVLVQGAIKRCFQCRSRGDLGSCKDPFLYSNATAIETVTGIQAIPCASGWCGKILEGGANQFKDEEYGVASERLCLQRGPSDNEERCAPTAWGNSQVQMCFCQGDLCNSASRFCNLFSSTVSVLILTILVSLSF